MDTWFSYDGYKELAGAAVGRSSYVPFIGADKNRPVSLYYAPIWASTPWLDGYEQVNTVPWWYEHRPYAKRPHGHDNHKQFYVHFDTLRFPAFWLWIPPRYNAQNQFTHPETYVSWLEVELNESIISMFYRANGQFNVIDIGGYEDRGVRQPGPVRIHNKWAEIGGVYFKEDRWNVSRHIVTINRRRFLRVENIHDEFLYAPLLRYEEAVEYANGRHQ